MIYFNFNGLQSDKLVVIPVSHTETPTAEDPQVLDVEIVIEGQSLFPTSGENEDALEELEAWCAIESGSFAVLFKNDDGNIVPSTIAISHSECLEPPTVVDFATSGDEFSFRVIAKRQLPQRLNDAFVVARDLEFTVTGSGGAGTGTIFQRLNNQWTSFSVNVSGTISLNGWHENAIEFSFFGTMRSESPFMTLVSTTVESGIVTRNYSTDVTVSKNRFVPEVEVDPEVDPAEELP